MSQQLPAQCKVSKFSTDTLGVMLGVLHLIWEFFIFCFLPALFLQQATAQRKTKRSLDCPLSQRPVQAQELDGHGNPEVTKSTSAPQRNNKLFSSLMASAEVLFALPMTQKFASRCATDTSKERSWLVTVCRIIIHTNFCRSVGFMH